MCRFLFFIFTSIVLFLSNSGNAQEGNPSFFLNGELTESIVVTDVEEVNVVTGPRTDYYCRFSGVAPQKEVLHLLETAAHYLIFSKCDSIVESRQNFMQNEILYQNDTMLLIHHWLAQRDFLETIHIYKLFVLEGDCKIQSCRFSNFNNETFQVFPCHLKIKEDYLEIYSGRKKLMETIPLNQAVSVKLRVYFPT